MMEDVAVVHEEWEEKANALLWRKKNENTSGRDTMVFYFGRNRKAEMKRNEKRIASPRSSVSVVLSSSLGVQDPGLHIYSTYVRNRL